MNVPVSSWPVISSKKGCSLELATENWKLRTSLSRGLCAVGWKGVRRTKSPGLVKMPRHFLWWLITMACVVWYSTVTIYVAFKGVADIRNMLARLAKDNNSE
jgi:hypothetical protein